MSPEEMQDRFLSDRAKTLLHHPQGMGNYFTFKAGVKILGLDIEDVAPDGVYNAIGEGYYDMGYMANHIGPPEKAIQVLKDASNKTNVATYPPDCTKEMKAYVAEHKFHRELGPDFEVMGVEGAQGGIGYVYLTFLNPGDEIIVTNPGYFHFVPAAESSGAKVVRIPLTAENDYRLKPAEVEAAITDKTKLIVVCDPVNPFGTVQTKEELLAIADIARRNGVMVFNNITHNTHHTDKSVQQIPMASLHSDETPMDHVVSTSGTSKGFGMPGLRVGFLAGHPALLRGAFLTKMEITKIHINYPGQFAALAAMKDHDYVDESVAIIQRNLAHIEETVAQTDGVTIPVRPSYGFCMMIDVGGTGVTAQEITVGLIKHKIAVTPGDGLGDLGATEYIRLNYSHPDIKCFETFRDALPKAIEEAKSGMYKQGVISFYEGIGSTRGAEIIEIIKARG
ncbi:MAG: pyridoxal phosphate-dependent aminotransferase [Tessaracoccus sp.]